MLSFRAFDKNWDLPNREEGVEQIMSGGMIGVFVAVLLAVLVFIWLQKRKPM